MRPLAFSLIELYKAKATLQRQQCLFIFSLEKTLFFVGLSRQSPCP
jgi:hypothetical protein